MAYNHLIVSLNDVFSNPRSTEQLAQATIAHDLLLKCGTDRTGKPWRKFCAAWMKLGI